MSETPPVAHSIAEIYLYLMVTPCQSCKKGPTQGADAQIIENSPDGSRIMSVQTICPDCNHQSTEQFSVIADASPIDSSGVAVVNPTDEPSQLIDIAQWLTLFRIIMEAASRVTQKLEARRLGIEAAQCLEEALRFFQDKSNQLPPTEAFFHESSRHVFTKNPQLFLRQRLIDLRAKLPTSKAMKDSLANPRSQRQWWPWGR